MPERRRQQGDGGWEAPLPALVTRLPAAALRPLWLPCADPTGPPPPSIAVQAATRGPSPPVCTPHLLVLALLAVSAAPRGALVLAHRGPPAPGAAERLVAEKIGGEGLINSRAAVVPTSGTHQCAPTVGR